MQLTRRRITAAAMDLIESEGVEAVSMQRLATELGCGLLSLFSYVPSRSALLDSVADTLLSRFESPVAGGASWQTQIRALARAFREMARARPRCTMVIVSRPPSSAGMLRPVERALATLGGAGFGGQESVRIVRTIVSYVMGSLLDEFGVAPGLDAHGAEPRRIRLRPGEFPNLTALAAEPEARNPDADFEFGLDLLIGSVAALRPARAAS